MSTFEEIQQANEMLITVDVKGKPYVTVNERVKAFRMVHPDGQILTEIKSLKEGTVLIKASAFNADGQLLASGYACEVEGTSNVNTTSYIENCETSAVGRALGFCGFGIDTAISSADELESALNQQKATKAQINRLKRELDESSIANLLRGFGIDKLEDLTKVQASRILGQ